MDLLEDLIILLPFSICFLTVLYLRQRQSSIIPINWPFFGSKLQLFVNIHRLHEYATDVLACNGGTFLFRGSILSKMDMLCTSNPADIQYIMTKNFPNYPKGDKFRQIFDVLGDGVSNSDGDIWEFHRKTLVLLLNHPSFHPFLVKTIWNRVENALLPVLDNISRQGVETDLQEIFQRFGFDIICELVLDYDPKSLSPDFPYIPCEKAVSHAAEAILYRHIMPTQIWKWQRLLRIGNEKKFSDAWTIFDQFIYKQVAENEKTFSTNMNNEPEEENYKFSLAIMRMYKDQSVTFRDPKKLLRDTLLNFIVAGRDTTSSTLSWFFYLLAKNPVTIDKIREEIKTQLKKEIDECNDIRRVDFSKLIYLHGGICEALRLFPPIPFQHKNPAQADVLPSGYQVDRNTTIILCFYTMGRMESIWGKDCKEFKPERWFATGGGIKLQPSYKFPAFNSGPRTCLGKQTSFTQMKIVAATIIYHYHVELVEGHPVLPNESVILDMKHGLKVRLYKRIED